MDASVPKTHTIISALGAPRDPFGDKDIAFSREHLNNDCRFQIKSNKSWEIQAFTNGSSGEDCDGGVKTLKQQPLP
ncbi:hypothetical protein EV1_013949 [Malus domestica]